MPLDHCNSGYSGLHLGHAASIVATHTQAGVVLVRAPTPLLSFFGFVCVCAMLTPRQPNTTEKNKQNNELAKRKRITAVQQYMAVVCTGTGTHTERLPWCTYRRRHESVGARERRGDPPVGWEDKTGALPFSPCVMRTNSCWRVSVTSFSLSSSVAYFSASICATAS